MRRGSLGALSAILILASCNQEPPYDLQTVTVSKGRETLGPTKDSVQPVAGRLVLLNKGETSLTGLRVRASCSCIEISAEWNPDGLRVWQPKMELEIPYKFYPRGHSGVLAERIVVLDSMGRLVGQWGTELIVEALPYSVPRDIALVGDNGIAIVKIIHRGGPGAVSCSSTPLGIRVVPIEASEEASRFAVVATESKGAGVVAFTVEWANQREGNSVGVPIVWSIDEQQVVTDPQIIILDANEDALKRELSSLPPPASDLAPEAIRVIWRELIAHGIAKLPVGEPKTTPNALTLIARTRK